MKSFSHFVSQIVKESEQTWKFYAYDPTYLDEPGVIVDVGRGLNDVAYWDGMNGKISRISAKQGNIVTAITQAIAQTKAGASWQALVNLAREIERPYP